MTSRRDFLRTAAVSPAVSALWGQTAAPPPDWGGPVIDIHLHLRRGLDDNDRHLEGSGVSNAILLAREDSAEQVAAVEAKYPGRFRWSASADVTKPDAAERLTKAVKIGAVGLGELKSHVEADGPELRRLYSLAAELNVPILVHFQEVDHAPGEGRWSSGFKRFEAVLKAYPKTTFVGHADAFWANISADYVEQAAYPVGPIKPGGITDRWLSDYPNLYGDLSANSGNSALTRDPGFTPDFLARHQEKLMFGSDCACNDGRGSGITQPNNPGASRLAGKCVARETLAVLKSAASPELFRKLCWDNAHRVYRLEKA